MILTTAKTRLALQESTAEEDNEACTGSHQCPVQPKSPIERAQQPVAGNRAAAAVAEMRVELAAYVLDGETADEFFARCSAEAKAGWLAAGALVTPTELASTWGVSEAALNAASVTGRLFCVPIDGQQWYLVEWLKHTPDEVAAVNLAFGAGVDAVARALWWWRKHGGLRGLAVSDALRAGVPLDVVTRQARSYGAEFRGEPGE